MTFDPPKKPYQYPDRLIDCQVAIDEAFQEMWEDIAAAGWGREEIANAIYELTDNHLTGLRENETVDRWLSNAKQSGR